MLDYALTFYDAEADGYIEESMANSPPFPLKRLKFGVTCHFLEQGKCKEAQHEANKLKDQPTKISIQRAQHPV